VQVGHDHIDRHDDYQMLAAWMQCAQGYSGCMGVSAIGCHVASRSVRCNACCLRSSANADDEDEAEREGRQDRDPLHGSISSAVNVR
jgi:hypothetical protein